MEIDWELLCKFMYERNVTKKNIDNIIANELLTLEGMKAVFVPTKKLLVKRMELAIPSYKPVTSRCMY